MKLQFPVPSFCMINFKGGLYQVVYVDHTVETFGERWYEVEDGLSFDEVLDRVRHIPHAENTIRLVLSEDNTQVWI